MKKVVWPLTVSPYILKEGQKYVHALPICVTSKKHFFSRAIALLRGFETCIFFLSLATRYLGLVCFLITTINENVV